MHESGSLGMLWVDASLCVGSTWEQVGILKEQAAQCRDLHIGNFSSRKGPSAGWFSLGSWMAVLVRPFEPLWSSEERSLS